MPATGFKQAMVSYSSLYKYGRKGRGIGAYDGANRKFFFVYPSGRRRGRRPERNRPRLTRPRGSRGNLQLMVLMSRETNQEGVVDGSGEGGRAA